MADAQTAYHEYAQQGLKPVRCFPNSIQPLWAELHEDTVSDEDASGWEDFNVGIRAHKNMSALVFLNFSSYRDYLTKHLKGTPMERAPTVMHPDATVAVWFKNKDWRPVNMAHDNVIVVNVGVLPAPPSRIGDATTEFLHRPIQMKVPVYSIAGGVTIKEYSYGDAVIPLKGFLSFGFAAPCPLLAGGLLDDKSKTVIVGEPKIGKSRFALNMAFCLATGRPFLDVEVLRTVCVLFVQFEGTDARFHERVLGLAREHRLPADTNVPLHLATLPWLHLDKDAGVARFNRLVKACHPEVVFLDPMYKIHRSEENSASEMQGLYDRIDELIREHSVSFVITHHVNKREDVRGWMRVRGSGQFPAWVDGLISLDRPGLHGDIEATALLRSGEGFVKTIGFNEHHLLVSKGDQTAVEVFCAELVITQANLSRRQMASRVAKEFSMTIAEVYEAFRHLEEKGYVLPA